MSMTYLTESLEIGVNAVFSWSAKFDVRKTLLKNNYLLCYLLQTNGRDPTHEVEHIWHFLMHETHLLLETDNVGADH